MLYFPAGGGTFLVRQESTQRMRHRGGAKKLLPQLHTPSPMYPTRGALSIEHKMFRCCIYFRRRLQRTAIEGPGGSKGWRSAQRIENIYDCRGQSYHNSRRVTRERFSVCRGGFYIRPYKKFIGGIWNAPLRKIDQTKEPPLWRSTTAVLRC